MVGNNSARQLSAGNSHTVSADVEAEVPRLPKPLRLFHLHLITRATTGNRGAEEGVGGITQREEGREGTWGTAVARDAV